MEEKGTKEKMRKGWRGKVIACTGEKKRKEKDVKGTEDLDDVNGCYVHYNSDGGRVWEQRDHDLKEVVLNTAAITRSHNVNLQTPGPHVKFHFNTFSGNYGSTPTYEAFWLWFAFKSFVGIFQRVKKETLREPVDGENKQSQHRKAPSWDLSRNLHVVRRQC